MMATAPQARRTCVKLALSIKTAESESPAPPNATEDFAESGNACTSPESFLLESPSVATPTTPPLVNPPTRAPRIRQIEEPFDRGWTNEVNDGNEGLSSSMTHAQAYLHKDPVQEGHSLLHLLDSKITWSESSDAIKAPYQEIEPERHQTPAGVGAWFRSLGRWFGHSNQAAGIIPEVKIELDDMPVDEFPVIPHTSGEYKPPWLSLVPLHPPGQSIVATLDFSAFDRVVDEPVTTALSKEGDGDNSN